MKTIIIVLLTIFAVYRILLSFGVFEFSSQHKKVVSEIESARKINKKRKSERSRLKMYATITELFRGILMSKDAYDNHKYYIDRLDIRAKYLNRLYTPEELRGKKFFPVLLSILVIPLAAFDVRFLIIPAVCLISFVLYQGMYKAKIRDEDEIIDNYFIDLYLLLYSKLRQGSRARLQGTVENYIDTLESQSNSDVKKVMIKLARHFLNLLALYEDHVAVPMLRDLYKSATIINFCNVASQALNGIKNEENLLTFKLMLVERKTTMMRIRQQRILRSGERSIYAIWIILFIFIAVGWYSKLPTGFF